MSVQRARMQPVRGRLAVCVDSDVCARASGDEREIMSGLHAQTCAGYGKIVCRNYVCTDKILPTVSAKFATVEITFS